MFLVFFFFTWYLKKSSNKNGLRDSLNAHFKNSIDFQRFDLTEKKILKKKKKNPTSISVLVFLFFFTWYFKNLSNQNGL